MSADILRALSSERAMIEPDGFVSLLRPYLFGRGFRLPRRAIVGFRYMGWLLRQVKERPSFRQHRWPEPGDVLMDFLYRGRRIAYLNLQALGGPLAAWGVEALIALGVKEVIVLGSSGALIKEIGRGDLILPAAAVREEGTSYHYLPPDQTVHANPRLRGHLVDVMGRLGIAYHQGDVWTTDALFRETRHKVENFRNGGVVCVDMEAASLFAVAQYRGIDLACLFYGGDSLAEGSWDLRLAGEMHPHQLRMLEIACRALVVS